MNDLDDERRKERVLRVFISSTFLDMQKERDELVKRVFPELRSICEKRSVVWGEVDLRWGITDEQRAEGQVLPICLAEIERCRPFFIGILGHRYGWIPSHMPPDLLDRETWLRQYEGCSVTELEILHGALMHPETAGRVRFYVRDSAYLTTLSDEERQFHEEKPTSDEVRTDGLAEAQRRSAARTAKLAALRARIDQGPFRVRSYGRPEELAHLVRNDLADLIDEFFPVDDQPSPLEGEARGQQALQATYVDGFVGRMKELEGLAGRVENEGARLVITGAPGSGVSSLLARFAHEYTHDHPSSVLVFHAVGATAESSDWTLVARRILDVLNSRMQLGVHIPKNKFRLPEALRNALELAAGRGRVLLIVDALHLLEDREGALDLVWLPENLPRNVRVVASTAAGKVLDTLTKRSYEAMPLAALAPLDRRLFASTYLKRLFGKEPPGWLHSLIAESSECGNALYLRLFLEELRMHGDATTLRECARSYLREPNVTALYARILSRYENDYERDRPGLVGDTATLIWAGRRGLAEVELLELLGGEGAPLPRAYFSPLLFAFGTALIDRAGLQSFRHAGLRDAVEAKYLPDDTARRTRHLRLADYLAGKERTPRWLDELPWQLAKASEWDRLAQLLADGTFLFNAWVTNASGIREYWSQVERHSQHTKAVAYAPLLADPTPNPFFGAALIELFADSEDHLPFRTSVRSHSAVAQMFPGIAENDLAAELIQKGDYISGLALLSEAERKFLMSGNDRGIAYVLSAKAIAAKGRRDLVGALDHLTQARQIFEELLNNDESLAVFRDLDDLAKNRRVEADICYALGQDAQGDVALHAAETACKMLDDREGLASISMTRAIRAHLAGRFREAAGLYARFEREVTELGLREGLMRALGNRAVLALQLQDPCAVRLAEEGLHLAISLKIPNADVWLREIATRCELGRVPDMEWIRSALR